MALSKLFIQSLKKIPGLTFYDVGAKTKGKISLVFRYTDSEGKRISSTKSFDPNTATEAEVLEEIEPIKKEFQSKLQKKGGDVNIIREQYTKAKLGFTDELINWLETNASNPKYKSPEQLLQAAEKAFDQPMYTQVPAKVEKAKAFFNKERGFLLPRQYEFYGKSIESKNPKKPLKDMAMIALLKSDNPTFLGKKDTLLKYFARDPKSPKPELTKEENKFLNMFSKEYIKGGAGGAGVKGGQETGSIMFRYLKNEGANFENKLNEWNQIRRLETDIKKELELGDLTQNRINFLTKTLRATQDKRKNISEKLRKEYPSLLSGKTGDVSGSLVQEHKVARAIGEKSASYIPSTYLAKAEFTPAAFNLQKLKDFDKPLMKYIDQYNNAKLSDRPEIIKQIKNLKKEFNLKTGGYLDDVDIQFGTKTVKIKDKTPFVFETSPEQTYSQILKNIKHSNNYFKNIGMNDRIISGDSFNAFQKDLKTRIVNQKGANLKSTLMGLGIGVPTANATLDAIEQNPLQAAEPQQAVSVPEDIEFGDPETWDKKVLDFMKEYPVVSGTAAGTTAIGGTLATKTGRKVLGQIGQAALSTPAGMVALNTLIGVDPTSTLDRTFLEAELAAAPGLVKSAEAMTTNPLLRKALTLGISPRMANIMSGAGITALAGEALYERGKGMMEEAEKISAMEPDEEQQRAIEEYAAEAYKGYAMGGRVGLKDGSKPPKMDRRTFMKIMGGIMSLPVVGRLKKPVKEAMTSPVVKKGITEAESLFFDLIRAVKQKGYFEDALKTYDELPGLKYTYGDAEVIEDSGTILARFKTDKGVPAEILYRKPYKDVNPDTKKVYDIPGEFDYEAQEIARINPEGDVDIDAEFEIIDSLENVKKLIND